ncbi:family 64 glycoside hydrolase [Cryphonectria parasitica EP155]|uniref:Family 64 glycoside hydrolase n=1 Tax=Cryphonectria parasitica (strain ATCC 38755 / EP155) TaxID=660469 RepID=A0A9P4XT52_CRYP1|nr:family 64 glycoside hydrolase [Cryphonectria parasitica EP155]KAF3760433.1 family 64 glycoside hydrolase [Cryphonectria parasitica EP155]
MPDSLDIQLQNQTNSDQVWAYITGIAISNGQRVLLKSNGRDLYYPQQVSQIGSPLAEDCAIPLGPPGNTVSVHIPQIAGGRIWFSCDGKLQFLLNPGPALVEPSVLNPSDPNADVNFCFAEFTLNSDQLYANISYVDFVSRLPTAMTLETAGGAVQHVSGMAHDGIDRICDGLRAQAARDGLPWDKLIVQRPGQPVLRVLNPTHGDAVGAGFAGYFEPYIDEVWDWYSAARGSHQMRINTQAAAGTVTGTINEKGDLVFGEEAFQKPTTADVLGCNSGPFTTGPSAYRNSVIPRLAAAFQRSALVGTDEHPSDPSTFYQRDPTNHYCRIVHEANLDGKGRYGFAYDDVAADGGPDQSGKVNAGDPKTFIVAVGGNNAYAGDHMPSQHIPTAFTSSSSAAAAAAGRSHHGQPPPAASGASDPPRRHGPSMSRFRKISAKAQKWFH